VGNLRRNWPIIVLASVFKFSIFPALTLGLAIWLQLDLHSQQIILLFAFDAVTMLNWILSSR
jgi:malonate transporter and related proteins